MRIPTSPPLIAALKYDVKRPLWSVMIPTYNCTSYLKEALISVLSQNIDVEDMQIEVIDDASTDEDVESLVALVGLGRVQYFRQQTNVGSLRNFETCINRSRGHLVHLLHSDDRVTTGFYKKFTRAFQDYPEAGAVFSRYAFINENGSQTHVPPPESGEGIIPGWLLKIAEYQRIQYASIVVRREVYEKLGGFYGTTYGEDWEMWVRIARHYPMVYIREVLAEYRDNPKSISSDKAKAGHLISDLMQVIARIQQHLPETEKKRILKTSGKYYALLGIGTTYQGLQKTNDWALAKSQMKQVLKFSKHPAVYYHLFIFYLKLLLRTVNKN
jgi:GT2 family glycosyltransferase